MLIALQEQFCWLALGKPSRVSRDMLQDPIAGFTALSRAFKEGGSFCLLLTGVALY